MASRAVPLLAVVVAALGAVAAVAWIARGPEGDSGPEEASPTAPVATPSPVEEPLALVGPPAAEVASLGIDPSTGLAARAELRFVTGEGAPAPRVRATYAPVGSEDLPLKGLADAAGVMKLHASVVGRRLLVDVQEGKGWGAERFDLWALDGTVVVLGAGCQAWLVLKPEHADLVGRRARFRVDGVDQAATVAGLRSLLGKFHGSALELVDVDGWPAGDGAQVVVLPPAGSVDVPWEGLGGERKRLRFEAPAGVAEVPRVRLTAEGGSDDEPLEPHASGPGWVEFRVSPLRRGYVYLAACEDAWAFGRVRNGQPVADSYPPRWQKGCRLEAVFPEPGPALWARAFVVSDPAQPLKDGAPLDVADHARILQNPDTDWMDFGAERSAARGLEWPLEPDLTRSRAIWRCVPNGCALRVLVAGTPHGTLSHDVTIPARTERLQVTLAAAIAFTLAISGPRTTMPGEEEWLTVACDDGRRGACTVFLPREQNRVVVRGFPAGGTADVKVFGGGVFGEAHLPVTAGAVVPLVLRDLTRRRHEVRVVDADEKPLKGVGVEFSGGHGGTVPICVRTDVQGIAARDLVAEAQAAPADGTVEEPVLGDPFSAEVNDPRFVSVKELCRPGAVTVLHALPSRTLRLEFDLGERVVEVAVAGSGNPPLNAHVRPGSLLVRSLGVPTTTVTVSDEAGEILFEKEVTLSPSTATTVRVAR